MLSMLHDSLTISAVFYLFCEYILYECFSFWYLVLFGFDRVRIL